MINTLQQFFFRSNARAVFSSPFHGDSFYWWLLIAFSFLMMEMGHPGLFYFLSFFFGGLAAAATSFITESSVIQILVFFCSTLISLYILRRWAAKNRSAQHTNFYALKGKKAIVKQDIIGENPGLVTVGGQVWVARVFHHNERIFIGDMVEIIDVRGAHVVVKKV